MGDARRLALVRGVRTAIYLVMVAAILVLLFAAATGYAGVWLWSSLGLLAVEPVCSRATVSAVR